MQNMPFFKPKHKKGKNSMEMGQMTYEAIYGYEASRPGDLTFLSGDELEVVGKQEGGWWKAINKRTGQKGYIPHNFIKEKPEESTVDSGDRPMVSLGWYVAVHDFMPTDNGSLFLKKNQRMEILEKTNDQWWYARITHDGKQELGYVPPNFISPVEGLFSEKWYFGTCSRQEAYENLLLSLNTNGSFLIRESSSDDGYSLSVRLNNEVKHYRINRDDQNKLFVSRSFMFDTVQDLVKHYQDNPGLCTRLREPCRVEAHSPSVGGIPNQVNDKKPEWEIDRNTIVLDKKLGSGQFGEVLKGIWNGNLEVAVKSMKPGCMEVEEFMREAETMQKLKHPKLVKLYGLCTLPDTQPLFIVTEFVVNGALSDHLRTTKRLNNMHPVGELIDMGAQVASGMAYLESQSIVHRDLAARNVLIGQGTQVKIADFGLARVMKEEIYMKGSEGKVPIKWTAPEAIDSNLYTSKSDVWSFGILLHEIITHGDPPYSNMHNQVVICWIKSGKRMERASLCPDLLYEFMLTCWESNPDARPTFKDLKIKMNALKGFFSANRRLNSLSGQ